MILNAKLKKYKDYSTQFKYITFGKGNKNLILIQGLNTNDISKPILPIAYMYRKFAKEYKVYIFDRKKDIKENVTVEDLANDLAYQMNLLKINKADIVGVSQGGMIAQYLAINNPNLVDKLVLAVTLSKNNSLTTKVVNNWIQLTKENKFKQLMYDMLEKLYTDKYMKKYKIFIPLLTLLQKPKNVNRFINLCNACLTCNSYYRLNEIKNPVLVISAKKDKIVGYNSSTEIVDKLQCEHHIFENFGHAVYEENIKEFNKVILEFLKK